MTSIILAKLFIKVGSGMPTSRSTSILPMSLLRDAHGSPEAVVSRSVRTVDLIVCWDCAG